MTFPHIPFTMDSASVPEFGVGYGQLALTWYFADGVVSVFPPETPDTGEMWWHLPRTTEDALFAQQGARSHCMNALWSLRQSARGTDGRDFIRGKDPMMLALQDSDRDINSDY